MKKIKTLLKGPALTQSGYGNHCRQIVRALLKDPTYDVYVENIIWGACSFLTEDTEEKRTIRSLIEKRVIEKHQGNNKFDLFIHVSIPNEFEKLGTFNVGVTAGIETDRVSHVWIQKCNEMDLIVVPSQHSKKTIEDTTIDWQNPQTGQSGQFKLQKPIVVCNEGFNASVFYPDRAILSNIDELLDKAPSFNFLHVGQWGKGGYGEDRKNIALLVKYFIETFRGREDVGLILKINMARNSIIDYENIVARLKEIKSNFKEKEVPPIFLIHANLSEEELASLYVHPKVKSMISLTHGEGFCGLDYTKIITERGLKRLDEVKVGERVLTHKGRFMPVTQELSRDYSGDMYEISTFNGANKEKITLTGNHRVCVFDESGKFSWVPAEDVKETNILCIPKPKYNQLETIEELNLSDYVKDDNVFLQVDIIKYRHSNTLSSPIKNKIKIDKNFGKIVGYYLAEGSFNKSTIHFSLHKDEKDTIAKELIYAFKDVFGLEVFNIAISENKLDLTFNSKIVGLFLKSFCGENAKNKFIHENVFKFSQEAKMNIVTSLINGDGYIKEKNQNSSIEISLVNDKLLRNLRILLLEENIISNFDFFNRKGIIKEIWKYDSNIERIRITNTQSFNDLVGWLNKNHEFHQLSEHSVKNISKGKSKSWTIKDYCLFEIKEINKISYEGKVYNISVQEDESYCTENFVVHNCLPLLEAAACDLPVLATNWSGHLDFLNLGKFGAIEYDLKEIPDSVVWENILIKGSKWACVREGDAKARMEKIVSSHGKPKEWAKDLGKKVREKFNLDAVCENFNSTIKQYLVSEKAAQIDPLEHLQSFLDTPENFNVIYTMPMSAGDVFISTAVIDGLVKELPEDHKIYFATSPQYADILKGNKNIYKVIPWNETMINVDLLDEVFDLALTPNVATHYTFSNWVRKGQGRLLAEEYANHCNTQLGDYFIEKDSSVLSELVGAEPYMTFHPGSGQHKWEARRYDDWQEVLNNLKDLYPEIKIVQLGAEDEPEFKHVDIDLRGKTNHQQLAAVIERSKLHLSIDTFTMHLAAALNAPLVALFGCSYATSTGPWVKNRETANFVLLQSDRLSGCKNKACYKDRCAKNPDSPPINEIDPKQIVASCCAFLGKGYGNKFETFEVFPYKRVYGKISGYTTTYNAANYPFEESIRSMLGFCDEVVVVDGCSDDGTYEKLEKLAAEDSRVKVYQNQFDWTEPGIDGMQKAFARALCENEYLWQMDSDELVHEDDYEKIKLITKRFPKTHDILHLPVIELWGNGQEATGRRHCWKWRMSRNKPEITHAINKHARVTDEKTGKVYAKKGMSDGCEYVNAMTYEPLGHTGFYNDQIEIARMHIPERYTEGINQVFERIPSVYHYSWCSIERKLNQLKKDGVWDRMWSLLYQEETQDRFPGYETPEQLKELAQKLYKQGGEDSDQVKYKFKISRPNPALADDWLKKVPLIK